MRNVLLALFPFALSIQTLAADTVVCSGVEDAVGIMHLNGPIDKMFSVQKCVAWNIKDDCYLAPGPEDGSNVCECVKVEEEVHHYQSWLVTGEFSIQTFHIDLGFELVRYSDSSDLGGTQFGTMNNIKYVANFGSGEDPNKDLTISLQRRPVGGEYSDTIFNKIDCTFK